jgi:hypothetical protein
VLLAVAQRHALLFQLLVKLSVAFDGQVHPGNEDHIEKCLEDKYQDFHLVFRVFHVERPTGRQQEERGRSSADDNTEKAATKNR